MFAGPVCKFISSTRLEAQVHSTSRTPDLIDTQPKYVYSTEHVLFVCLVSAQKPQPVWVHDRKQIRRREMRRNPLNSVVGLVVRPSLTVGLMSLILLGSAVTSSAQVKRVQMHIAGYLCGN